MRRITDWFRRRSKRTLRIPGQGTAFVLSDLHGNVADFHAFLDKSQVLQRLEAGDDVWLLITGDVPDVVRHQQVDPRVQDGGDVQILDELVAARERLGDRGKRIVYLEGNHDFHVARICGEVARYHAYHKGGPMPRGRGAPEITPAQYMEYCLYYRDAYGEAVFKNNIAPYDMVPRAKEAHLRFLKSGPILAVLERAQVMVTHAGPPRMEGTRVRDLLKQIDRADASRLRDAAPETYYASPYHQLLNNRFRNGDYSLDDLDKFLGAYQAKLLITGHTPHPYLVDFEKKAPLADCGFQDGIGFIGGGQVVLCSSFGAFHAGSKRYLEIDMSRPHESVRSLFEGDGSVRPLYTAAESADVPGDPLPGAEIAFVQ